MEQRVEIPAPPPPPEPGPESPTCERCAERLARIEEVARGNGTVPEIREALTALENVARSGAPLGQKYVVDGLLVCPRCTPAKSFGLSDDETEPLIAVVPFHNRRDRRYVLKRARRQRWGS